jgi:hypothetical protein
MKTIDMPEIGMEMDRKNEGDERNGKKIYEKADR